MVGDGWKWQINKNTFRQRGGKIKLPRGVGGGTLSDQSAQEKTRPRREAPFSCRKWIESWLSSWRSIFLFFFISKVLVTFHFFFFDFLWLWRDREKYRVNCKECNTGRVCRWWSECEWSRDLRAVSTGAATEIKREYSHCSQTYCFSPRIHAHG